MSAQRPKSYLTYLRFYSDSAAYAARAAVLSAGHNAALWPAALGYWTLAVWPEGAK